MTLEEFMAAADNMYRANGGKPLSNEFEYEGTDESALATAKRRMAERDAEYQLQQAFLRDQVASKPDSVSKPVPKKTGKKAPVPVVVNPLGIPEKVQTTPTILPNGLPVGSMPELMRRPNRQPIFSKPQPSPEMLEEEALAERNYQAIRQKPPAGSVAGNTQRGQVPMVYPSPSSWIPQWMSNLFSPANIQAARSTELPNMDMYGK